MQRNSSRQSTYKFAIHCLLGGLPNNHNYNDYICMGLRLNIPLEHNSILNLFMHCIVWMFPLFHINYYAYRALSVGLFNASLPFPWYDLLLKLCFVALSLWRRYSLVTVTITIDNNSVFWIGYLWLIFLFRKNICNTLVDYHHHLLFLDWFCPIAKMFVFWSST